jgi:hypothetical protein
MDFISQHPEMNPQGVLSCLAAHRGDPIIEKDRLTAQKLGISGTPTLFVNGVQARGVTTIDSLIAVIDKQSSMPDGLITKTEKTGSALNVRLCVHVQLSPG